MSPAATYAAMVFSAGILLFAIWFYANSSNGRCWRMLGKSVLLFAVPIIAMPVSLFQFPLGMVASAACEEGLKAFSANGESRPINKFWIVSLFGIWELALDKPFWGLLNLPHQQGAIDSLATIELVFASLSVVLMHTVTAAIYGFGFERRLWAAFISSWAIHSIFNAAASYPTPIANVAKVAALGALFIFLYRRSSHLNLST